MAPEVIQQIGHISTSCDIWSVGCTVIELLTERPPYYDQIGWSAMYKMVTDQHPPLPEGISAGCKDFLLQCFEKEPTLRLDACALLRHTWIREQQHPEVYDIINSPHNDFPEEVTNTIRLHINDASSSKTEAQAIQSPSPVGNKKISKFKERTAVTQAPQVQADYNVEFGISSFSQFRESQSANFPSAIAVAQRENIVGAPVTGSFAGTLRYDSMSELLLGCGSAQKEGSFVSVSNEGNGSSGVAGVATTATAAAAAATAVAATSHELLLLAAERYQGAPALSTQQSFDSVRNLKFTKRSGGTARTEGVSQRTGRTHEDLTNQQNQQKNKQEYNLYKEIHDLLDNLLQKETKEEIEELVELLSDLLREYPKCKYYIMKQYGLTDFLRLIDLNESLSVTILSLVNLIIENDATLLEHACLYGLLPYTLRFAGSENANDVRIEAAYFLGQLACTSPNTLQIFVIGGGLEALVEFLDVEYPGNKELICMALDTLNIVFECKLMTERNLCKMLARYNICHRLLAVVDVIHCHEDQQGGHLSGGVQGAASPGAVATTEDSKMRRYLQKALQILLLFSKMEDKRTKLLLCEDEILSLLLVYLQTFESDTASLFTLFKLFKYVTKEISVHNKLENLGLLPLVVELLRKTVDGHFGMQDAHDATYDLMMILDYLSRLSAPRQEQLALHNALPLLMEISESAHKALKKMALQLLIQQVQTSALTRQKLWEVGGPRVFFRFLEDKNLRAKMLNVIALWSELEPEKTESVFRENDLVQALVDSFCQSEPAYFQDIIPIYTKLIVNSRSVEQALAKSTQFLRELVVRLGVCDGSSTSFATPSSATAAQDSTTNHLESAQIIQSRVQSQQESRLKNAVGEEGTASAMVTKDILDILLQLCTRQQNAKQILEQQQGLQAKIAQILQRAQREEIVILEDIATQLLLVTQPQNNLKDKIYKNY